MPLGISLSQLIQENRSPFKTGIDCLDDALNGGFQTRSIYEIYGPPGVGKTTLGTQIVRRMMDVNEGGALFGGDSNYSNDNNVLWVQTFCPFPNNMHPILQYGTQRNDRLFKVTIRKVSEMLVFFERLLNVDKSYNLIIIDGFSQVVVTHLNILLQRGIPETMLHKVKCRHLILLLTAMTKYTHSRNSTILLLNDCMNSSYQHMQSIYEDNFELIDDGTNFFVSSTINPLGNFQPTLPLGLRRGHAQVLKSALVANCAVGNEDDKWEIFLKGRIGLFWDWQNEFDTKLPRKKLFAKSRIAIVNLSDAHSGSSISQRELRRKRTRESEDKYNSLLGAIVVKFDFRDPHSHVLAGLRDIGGATVNLAPVPLESSSTEDLRPSKKPDTTKSLVVEEPLENPFRPSSSSSIPSSTMSSIKSSLSSSCLVIQSSQMVTSTLASEVASATQSAGQNVGVATPSPPPPGREGRSSI